MEATLGYLREMSLVSIILRVLLSMGIGALLGLERGMKHSPAGLRTYMLVCLGANLVMMTNQYVFQTYHTSDPVRMGAQVISGIGFLGAGTIIVTGRQQIRGITTAAGLWVAACCGLSIGIGFYEGAVIGGFFVYMVMSSLNGLNQRIKRHSTVMTIYVEYGGENPFSTFLESLRSYQLEIIDMQVMQNKYTQNVDVCVVMNLRSCVKRSHEETLHMITEVSGVYHVEEL